MPGGAPASDLRQHAYLSLNGRCATRLLQECSSPDKQTTVLLLAASFCRTECLSLILEQLGITVNTPDNTGLTALMVACNQNHPFYSGPGISGRRRTVFVRALLALGADATAVDSKGFTPAHYLAAPPCGSDCESSEHSGGERVPRRQPVVAEVMDLLISAGASMLVQASGGAEGQRAGSTPLHLLLKSGFEEVAFGLLLHLAPDALPVNVPDEDGYTPLLFALLKGMRRAAGILMDRLGADPTVRTRSGSGALHCAALGGDVEAARRLVDQLGFAVNDAGAAGAGASLQTPLAMAACGGHPQMLRFLLDKGAEIECRDENGETTLMYAALLGKLECVRLLLERGADCRALNNSQSTALHAAAQGQGCTEMIQLLVKAGADANAADAAGQTPLHVCAINGREHILGPLIMRHGADVSARMPNGATPLLCAAREGHQHAFFELLFFGQDNQLAHLKAVDACCNNNVIHRAVLYGDADFLLQMLLCLFEPDLIFRGVALELLNAHNKNGVTPILLAAQHGYLEAMKVLKRFGADVHACDPEVSDWRDRRAIIAPGW